MMHTWSLETVARRAVSVVGTPLAVAVHGILETLWPPRYVPVEVPDTWLDTYEEENETLEPRCTICGKEDPETGCIAEDDAGDAALWRAARTAFQRVPPPGIWSAVAKAEGRCPNEGTMCNCTGACLSSAPVGGVDGSGGAEDTPPPEPTLAEWLEPAVKEVLAQHRAGEGGDQVFCDGLDGEHAIFYGGDWYDWVDHVSPFVAAHVAQALKARAGEVS